MKKILIFLLITISLNQKCVDSEGKKVDWWAILKVPPKIGSSGYGYVDSTTLQNFKYLNTHVDEGKTALTMTLSQINSLKL